MKKRLSFAETLSVGSMLFGLFFGAGNLIFPVYMGQAAGSRMWVAVLGFLVTGVGIPLLGVAALGMSRSSGLLEMSSKAGRKYGLFFTCLLYLTIGPFFAIPRCASTSFSVGIRPALENESSAGWVIWVFSFLFFAAVLWFSLRPGKILLWVGKLLTPLFLVSLGLLTVTALIFPMGEVSSVVPQEAYQSGPFFKGFLEGYNTMDALAGLAFGIVVVNAIQRLGVTEPAAVAGNTIRSGIFGCALMAIIYILTTWVGAQSRVLYPMCADGGEVLHVVARHYFKDAGAIILAVIVTLACLKTAVGLITSCGECFSAMFPKGPSYRVWAIGFCVLSFLIATLGLDTIIAYSIPVLMFLYPLAITLILLALCGRLFGNDRTVYAWTTGFTLAAAVFDLVKALPQGLLPDAVSEALLSVGGLLPFFDLGLGWICPAAVGLGIGLIIHAVRRRRGPQQAEKPIAEVAAEPSAEPTEF